MIPLPERPGRPAPPDLAARRAGLADALVSGVWAVDPAPVDAVTGGVRTLRFEPPGRSRATVLHFHGGAYRMGCPEQLGPFAVRLAERCAVTVVCPAYRLAPEHPFPAAIHDARAVVGALNRQDGPVILSGDSAGGGLAAALTLLASGDAAPPSGLILLSAWLDLRCTALSYATNAATDPLFSRASAKDAAELYLQGQPADHPLASPLLGDLRTLPPVFASVGVGEVLLDDATGLHSRLVEAGVSSTIDIVPGMEHVAVTRGIDLEGAERSFSGVTHFIDDLLN